MTTILVVADRQSVIDRMHAALSLPDVTLVDHEDPETAAATARELDVDRVIVDMQVGSMGAMAVTRAVRAATADAPIPVTILLDRDADAFLARRSGARNWLSKDAAAVDLREAVLAGPTTP
jgi:DNA-binding NarL/FixJ family response regulator